MKTFNQHPDTLFITMIKLSIFFMLLLIVLNGLNVNAQSINLISEISRLAPKQHRVRQIYTSQIGIKEKQSNSGPHVEKYLRYVNLPKGNPWCAAFVCWVFGEAGVGNPRTGWSPDLFPAGKVIWVRATESGKPAYRTGRLKTEVQRKKAHSPQPIAPSPKSGDVFGLYFPEKGRIAHVGFIDKWDGTWLTSVEGNTNLSGSREGDGVYRKRRLVRSVYKVARYVR